MGQLELIYQDLWARAERITQKEMPPNTGIEDYEKYKTVAKNLKNQSISTFKRHLTDQRVKFIQNKEMFKPIDYIIPLREILFNLIEKNVKFIQVNSPENSNFLNGWNEFRTKYALFNLLDVNKIIEHIDKYLSSLQNEIEKACPSSIYENFLASNVMWSLLKETLLVDIDFLKTPVAFLIGLCNPEDKFLTISAEHLLEANNFLVDKFLGNLPWVLNAIEEKLKPFTALPQNSTLNYSKILLERISYFRELYLPKISSLHLQNYQSCSPQKTNLLNSLINLKNEWSQDYEEVGATIYARIRDGIHFSSLETTSAPRTNFLSNEGILDMLKAHQSDLYEVREARKKGESIPQENEFLVLLDHPANCKSLEDSIKFHEVLHQCDALLQTYLYENIDHLNIISTNINNWYSGLSNPYKKKDSTNT